jgi:hypothetical protein
MTHQRGSSDQEDPPGLALDIVVAILLFFFGAELPRVSAVPPRGRIRLSGGSSMTASSLGGVGTSVGTSLRPSHPTGRPGAASPLILRVGAGSLRSPAVSLTA